MDQRDQQIKEFSTGIKKMSKRLKERHEWIKQQVQEEEEQEANKKHIQQQEQQKPDKPMIINLINVSLINEGNEGNWTDASLRSKSGKRNVMSDRFRIKDQLTVSSRGRNKRQKQETEWERLMLKKECSVEWRLGFQSIL